MIRSIATNLAAVALSASLIGLALPAERSHAADACRSLAEDTCIADVGCKWKASETWTRSSDGKTRTVKAKCSYDAKAARSIIQTALASHQAK